MTNVDVRDWRDALRDSPLPAGAKAIGFVLATYANGAASAYPSRRTLGAGASLSVRTVDRALHELEQARFVEIKRSRGRSSSTYTLTLPTASQAAPLAGVNGVTNDTVPRRQRRHTGASTVSPAAPEGAEGANLFTQKPRALRARRPHVNPDKFAAYD